MKKEMILGMLLLLTVFSVPSFVDAYVDHSPILIEGDGDWATYGFPGNGTEENPYLIDDLRITSVTYPEYPIKIVDTEKFFVISNCWLANYTNPPYAAIGLENVTNGRIENNIIDRVTMGIRLYEGTSFVSIFDNVIGGESQSSIRLENTNRINVTGNYIDGGILLEVTNDTDIFNNDLNHCVSYSGRNANIIGLRYNNTRIIDNVLLSEFGYNIVIETAENITISGNTCFSGGHVIYAHWTDYVIVSNNNITYYGELIDSPYCEYWSVYGNVVTRIDDNPPIIEERDDVSFEFGNDYNLIWHVDEYNPKSYQIERNGTLIVDLGIYGSSISYLIYGLDVGVHNYTLTVFDTRNFSDTDSVLVTVTEVEVTTTTTTTKIETTTSNTTTSSETEANEPIDVIPIFSVIGASCGIIALIIVLFKRKS